MSFTVQHLHVKTRDIKQTAQFYIDNFGATLKDEIDGRIRLDLHGLQLNITGLNTKQAHVQHYGFEHIGIETTDYAGTLARLRQNGARILEELPSSSGGHIAFVEAPDGAHMEVIGKAG